MTDSSVRAFGLLVARVILGLMFGMAGFYKVFALTAPVHAQRLFVEAYADSWIPVWLLWGTGFVIPFVELVAGWLLVIGWRTRECLVALGLVLMTVTYGHLLKEPLFNATAHVVPRTLFLLVLTLTARRDDWLSVDGWLATRANSE